MAQDAFQDVGIRLQERSHLDLNYNFGCHLTDDYRPGTDPALSDPPLVRRLQENLGLAMSQLDEVIFKYAMMQDKCEDGERQKSPVLPRHIFPLCRTPQSFLGFW
jgi:death-associated protein 6